MSKRADAPGDRSLAESPGSKLRPFGSSQVAMEDTSVGVVPKGSHKQPTNGREVIRKS